MPVRGPANLDNTLISGGDVMPDDQRLTDGLTEHEMQNAFGGNRPVDHSTVPDDARRVEEADLQRLSGGRGGARAVSGSEVPDDSDDGRVDAVDLRQVTGGTNAVSPTQIEDDDDGGAYERIHGVDISPH